MTLNSQPSGAVTLTAARPLRVVQWDTGVIGARALRDVIQHPALSLAGVYVHSESKDGRDAGELCGLAPVGVAATRDANALIALKPDCVIYMSGSNDVEEICRILAAGINVVSTAGGFHHPAGMDPVMRKQVEAACAEGGTSIHCTGSSPGFISEALPIVLASMQRRFDSYVIDEYADNSQRDSPEMLFDLMGFGRAPDVVAGPLIEHVRQAFGPSLQMTAAGLGLITDEVVASGELATARKTTKIVAGTIEAGTVGAQRLTVSALRVGEPLMTFRANWYCTTDLEQDWELRDSGWHVSIVGDCAMEIDIRFPISLDQMAEVSPGYTANRAVNAVPAVCAAAPGIRTALDLPQVIAQF
jgi:hypothetical protein